MELRLSEAKTRISVAAASLAMEFAANNDVRYYLNGINVRPASDGGVLVSGTDGHALICVRDRNGFTDKEVTLPLRGKGLSRWKRGNNHVCVSPDDVVWVCADKSEAAMVLPSGPIGGNFPKIEEMFGAPGEWVEGYPLSEFDTRLLERVTRHGGRGVRFFHKPGAPNHAALFTLGHDAFGLLMPRRADDARVLLESAIPPEFRGVKPRRAAAATARA